MNKRRGDTEGSGVNIPRKRHQLMQSLDAILEVAFSKYDNPRTKNLERQGWGRLIVNAVSAAGGLLEDQDLDLLAERIVKLEKEVKND